MARLAASPSSAFKATCSPPNVPRPHQAVIGKLDEMMGCDPAYILPAIEALANLCLTPDQQVPSAADNLPVQFDAVQTWCA